LVILSLVLAACATSTPQIEVEVPVEVPAEVEHERSETIYVSGAAWGPPSTWNPFQPGSLANTTGTIGNVYEFLFHFDPADDGQRRIRWSLEMPDGRMLNTGDHVVSAEAAMQILGGGGRPAPAEWKPVVSLYVTNDLTGTWQGHVRWSLETLDGQALETGGEAVTAPALSAVHVRTLDFAGRVNDGNRREVLLVYELWQGDERLSMGLVPFAPNKHLELSDPELLGVER
jgi:hypothetical protein